MKKSAKVFFVSLFVCVFFSACGCSDSDSQSDSICKSSETRCYQSILQKCLSGAWEDVGCPDETPVCHLGECIAEQPAGCDSGSKTCKDGQTLQVCWNGTWLDSPCTGSTPVCSDGRCVSGN